MNDSSTNDASLEDRGAHTTTAAASEPAAATPAADDPLAALEKGLDSSTLAETPGVDIQEYMAAKRRMAQLTRRLFQFGTPFVLILGFVVYWKLTGHSTRSLASVFRPGQKAAATATGTPSHMQLRCDAFRAHASGMHSARRRGGTRDSLAGVHTTLRAGLCRTTCRSVRSLTSSRCSSSRAAWLTAS